MKQNNEKRLYDLKFKGSIFLHTLSRALIEYAIFLPFWVSKHNMSVFFLLAALCCVYYIIPSDLKLAICNYKVLLFIGWDKSWIFLEFQN